MDKATPRPPRLVHRIGNHLPKWLRTIYYIVLFITFIYIIYRFIEWILVTIQKIGAFIFEPRNYWAAVMSLFILVIGAFLVAQFVLGLDPLGRIITWIQETFESIKGGLIHAGN